MDNFFPKWVRKHNGLVAPDERLSMAQTMLMGLQHVMTMLAGTIIVPLLTGFDINVAFLMSGVGTLLFFVITRGRVPSYLGSSFAFIGGAGVLSGYPIASFSPNPNIGVVLGGIVACGILYFLVGLLIKYFGYVWLDRLMPPVVTGGVMAIVGLSLAHVAVVGIKDSLSDSWYTLMTVFSIVFTAIFTRGMLRRLLIFIGFVLATVLYVVFVNLLGWGVGGEKGSKVLDFSLVAQADWFAIPSLTTPQFSLSAFTLIAPIAFVLLAENLNHMRTLSAMTGRDMNPYIGSSFMANGLATMVSGFGGGLGLTTYAENIAVMGATKVYSTLAFACAGILAIALGFSPKVVALIHAFPAPIWAGVSIVMFGLIVVSGVSVWVKNQVDFRRSHNLLVLAITLILGTSGFSVQFDSFSIGGIGLATLSAILMYVLLRPKDQPVIKE